MNTALGQVQVSLDGVNLQLAKVDTITEHAAHVTANVANLSTVVAAAAANPLVKVASFGYGLRKAARARRRADEEREVRDDAQAAPQGRPLTAALPSRETYRRETRHEAPALAGRRPGRRRPRRPQADPEGERVHPVGHRHLAVAIRWRPGRVGA